jgi:hypothetical protein
MLQLSRTAEDDTSFIDLISQAIQALAYQHMPEEIYITRIDTWFGHKWLGFAGKMLGALGVSNTSNLVIPPFEPNRVSEQMYFCHPTDSLLYEQADSPVQLHIEQSSTDNFNRRIGRFSRSCLFVWYSSSTATLDRASLMVYHIQDKNRTAWYLSFMKNSEWKLDMVKNISRENALLLFTDLATSVADI